MRTFIKLSLFCLLALCSFTVKSQNNDSNIVYGKVRFSDSRSQYLSVQPDSIESINGKKYLLTPNFNQDKLYRLKLESFPYYNIDDFEIALEEMISVIDIVSKKYGQPQNGFNISRRGNLNIGEYRYNKIWIINDKKIYVGLHRPSKKEYAVFITIIDANLMKVLERKVKTTSKF